MAEKPLSPDELDKARKLAAELNKDFDETKLSATQVRDLIKSWETELNKVKSSINDTYSSFVRITDELKNSNTALNNIKKSYSSLTSIAEKIQFAQQGTTSLSNDEIKKLKEKVIIEKKRIENSLQLLKDEKEKLKNENGSRDRIKEINKLIDEQNKRKKETNKAIKETLDALEKEKQINDKINKLLGVSGNLIGGANNLMDKLGLSGLKTYLNFDKAKEAMDETASAIARGEKAGGQLTVLFAGFKSLMGGLGNAIKAAFSPIGILTLVVMGLVKAFNFIKDIFFGIDTQAADLGKNMGISYSSALKYTEQLSIAAEKTNSNFVRTKEMVQSVNTLNNLFGTNIKFSDQLLSDFSVLRDEIGLSEEQLIGLYKVNALNSNTIKQSANDIVASTLQFNYQNKTAFTSKTIMDGIAKSSAAARLNFKGSVPELVKAVGEAKKLGLELDELNSIGRGLLNFEESIAAELEAELLTGRQINLDRARYYALTNDSAGLARELRAQIGTAAQFGKMNVLQQEAFAKALGMSKEQLAEMLETTELLGGRYESMDAAQEEYNKLREQNLSHEEIIKRMGKEDLVNKLKSNSIQEEFNALIEKLKETLANLARGPLGDILRYVQEWFNATDEKGIKNSSKLVHVFKDILGFIKDIVVRVQEWLNTPDEEGNKGFDKLKETLKDTWDIVKWIGIAFLAWKAVSIIGSIVTAVGGLTTALGGVTTATGGASVGMGRFFTSVGTGLASFAQAMAAPTPLFGLPAGLILVGVAMGLAAALRIAAPAIEALGPMFKGLGEGLGALAPLVEAVGTVLLNVFTGIGKVIESLGTAIATVITSIADSIVKLEDLNAGKLALVGTSLGAVGVGLLALTAGEVINGIANFFGASPVDTLKELESIDGVKIGVTASSIVTLAVAIKTLSNEFEKFNEIIDKVNTEKLKEIKSLSSSISAAKAVDTVVGGIKSAGKAITSFFGIGGKEEKATGATTTEKGGITINIQPIVDEIRILKTEFANLSKNINELSKRPVEIVLKVDGSEIKRTLVTGPNTFNN